MHFDAAKAALKLLPRRSLVKTSGVDHADWCYRPVLGTIIRARYQLLRPLLPKRRVETLLEIGYGSGIFLPTLHQYCERLLGLDVHDHGNEVSQQLRAVNVPAELLRASAEEIPLDNHSVDCVVAVSSLEFVPDLPCAVSELHRVLKPAGTLIIVTPGYSAIADFGLKLLTGESARKDYGDRRERLLPTLAERFATQTSRSFPPLVGRFVKLYTALQFTPRGDDPLIPKPHFTPGRSGVAR